MIPPARPRSVGFTVVSILLLAVVGWWLLGFWVVRGSERFYLLLPPVALALWSLRFPDGWRGFRPHLRGAILYTLGLLLFALAYAYFLTSMILRDASMSAVRGAMLREALVMAYFLAAIKLLLS